MQMDILSKRGDAFFIVFQNLKKIKCMKLKFLICQIGFLYNLSTAHLVWKKTI